MSYPNILQDVQTLGLLESNTDMATQLTELAPNEVAKLIKSFNHCEPLRYLLPDMVSDALAKANANNYKAEWLESQCGTTNGTNNPMASEEEWDEEADKLAEIITQSKEFNLNNLVLNDLSDSELTALEQLLLSINETQSLHLDGLKEVINALLTDNGYKTQVLGVYDGNDAGSSNKEEWALEIPTLISIVKQLNKGLKVSENIINDSAEELGELLNIMKSSKLFGNDVENNGDLYSSDNVFNALVIEILDETGLIKTSSNSKGFINDDVAKETDWSRYDWKAELTVVKNFDTEAETQSDNTIKFL